jgi:hypothetical protein
VKPPFLPSTLLIPGLFFSGAAAFQPAAFAQGPAQIASVEFVGQRTAVFESEEQSCAQYDIPDAPTRAFRDRQGMVHLISASDTLYQNIGPTLETVVHSCDVGMGSDHDPNPADFDDTSWLDSFFSIDGTNVVSISHMEYHGWSHPGECYEQGSYAAACWYNGGTLHVSKDGGYHFAPSAAPENYVLSLPFQYEVNEGPEGYSIATNILEQGGWYYAMVTDWPWPPNCGQQGQPDCLVPYGGAPMRTNNILDPASWLAWDGADFTVSFADPYPGPISHPEAHVYTPIRYLDSVQSINFHNGKQVFVALYFDPYDNEFHDGKGAYLATSTDMVNWSPPVLLVKQQTLLSGEPKSKFPHRWSYGYFSLIDPNATDLSFGTMTDTPYLYYVRFDRETAPWGRTLFMQPIQLNWK